MHFYLEFSVLHKRFYRFWLSEEAIPSKITPKKTKDLIERLNLKKFSDFVKITSNIENMLRTFSVENFIFNKKVLCIYNVGRSVVQLFATRTHHIYAADRQIVVY